MFDDMWDSDVDAFVPDDDLPEDLAEQIREDEGEHGDMLPDTYRRMIRVKRDLLEQMRLDAIADEQEYRHERSDHW